VVAKKVSGVCARGCCVWVGIGGLSGCQRPHDASSTVHLKPHAQAVAVPCKHSVLVHGGAEVLVLAGAVSGNPTRAPKLRLLAVL
jgi:hypothetical protein